uniref:Uncharacterized protein n=1 Tax=Ralstonia solanacearum TaxID=305 RepID=A0A0S4TYT0_RALSL|nr:protein of unknown function [Ralstonia solanacearum]
MTVSDPMANIDLLTQVIHVEPCGNSTTAVSPPLTGNQPPASTMMPRRTASRGRTYSLTRA